MKGRTVDSWRRKGWIAQPVLVWLATVALVALTASPASAQQWIGQSPTGTPPTPRYGSGQAYDAANDRLILVGGWDTSGWSWDHGVVQDVWVLSNATGVGGTPAWTQLAPTGGPPWGRQLGTVVYAPVSNSLVVFGGCWGNCAPAMSDVWVLSNANGLGGTPQWIQLFPSEAFGRAGHDAAYDPGTNRMISFGGTFAYQATDQNDVRVLVNADGTGGPPSWIQLAPTGGPPQPRQGPAIAYDAGSNRMILFGGGNQPYYGNPLQLLNDVWVLTNANGLGGVPEWIQLTPTGGLPGARVSHTVQYDPATNQLFVFGGTDTGTTPYTMFGDVWVLSHANGLDGTPEWTQLTPTGGPPAGRAGHSAGYSPATGRMVVAMGRNDAMQPSLLNDVWVLAIDSAPPTITITTPEDEASYTLGSEVLADYTCDDGDGSGVATCEGPVASGAAMDTATVGAKTFTVDATDNEGNASSLNNHYSVVFDYHGFLPPVDNLPTLNAVKAGAAVPVKFSFAGDQGLDIFATGYPKSGPMSCSAGGTVDAVEETVTAGSSGLSYDAVTGEYTYIWKTLKGWAGTCRQLVLELTDETYWRANFQFK